MESKETIDFDGKYTSKRQLDQMEFADIPECRPLSEVDQEHTTCPEERVWSTREEEDDGWINRYVIRGRSTLTVAQETQLGISKEEAMENACTGHAEQYIMDALYKAEYVPEVALQNILNNEIPTTIAKRLTAVEIALFHQGIIRHGTNFSKLQEDFLPGKDLAEIVEFYYTWKGSVPTTQERKYRHRNYLKARRRSKRGNSESSNGQTSRIMTRSSTLAQRKSKTPPRRSVGGNGEKAKAISSKENTDPQSNARRTRRTVKRRRTRSSPVEKVKAKKNNAVASTEE